MLLRNVNLAGPYPVSRDGKLLGEFLSSALMLDPDVPIIADVEVTSGASFTVKVKLRNSVTLDFRSGVQVTVNPDRTVEVRDEDLFGVFFFPGR